MFRSFPRLAGVAAASRVRAEAVRGRRPPDPRPEDQDPLSGKDGDSGAPVLPDVWSETVGVRPRRQGSAAYR